MKIDKKKVEKITKVFETKEKNGDDEGSLRNISNF